MKKINLIILILYMFLLSSCDDNIICKYNDVENNYIVKKIEIYDPLTSKYYLETGVKYRYYMDKINFVDKCGKFKTGDTVYVNFKTK